jgi:hypothetical protein
MKNCSYGLVLAGLMGVLTTRAEQYAQRVVDYSVGTLPRPVAGFTNTSAALGMPSRQTTDPDPTWGGTFPVDPFNGPYLANQVVSVGAQGSLTVAFAAPIPNQPGNPFGIDFIVFGNSTFIITNGNYSGGGVTDGSLFGNNAGPIKVSVSEDGITFYELHSSLAPVVDSYFPTDGSGDFAQPVNPAWSETDFAGQDLSGIRRLYAGSAGGSGFDLSWAQTSDGQPVSMAQANYVRIEVTSGHAEIDGFSVVSSVPEPSPGALVLCGGLGLILWRRSRAGHSNAQVS